MNTAYSYKIESLQALRGLLFIGVVMFHCGLGDQGACCVSAFFVLSGFVLTFRHYNSDNLKSDMGFRVNFALQHICKIYPLHLIMLLLHMLLRVIKSGGGFVSFLWICYTYIDKLIPNVLLIQSWYPMEDYYFSFNGVSWFLSTVLFCYFMFPIAFNWIKQHSKHLYCIMATLILVEITLSVVGSIITVLFSVDDLFGYWLSYIFPAYRLLDFMIGICMGSLYCCLKQTTKNTKKLFYSIAEILVLFLVAMEMSLYKMSEGYFALYTFSYSLLFIVSSALMVYLFAFKQGIISKCLTCRPLIFIGNL